MKFSFRKKKKNCYATFFPSFSYSKKICHKFLNKKIKTKYILLVKVRTKKNVHYFFRKLRREY